MTRDRKIVTVIIIGSISFSVISWFPNPETEDIIRTLLGAVLSAFLYLGYSWSRWVMGVLSGLAALIAAAALVSIPGNSWLVMCLMLCFYSYAAFYLLNPKLLQSHFTRENG